MDLQRIGGVKRDGIMNIKIPGYVDLYNLTLETIDDETGDHVVYNLITGELIERFYVGHDSSTVGPYDNRL